MSSSAAVHQTEDPLPIRACTVTHDVQRFDLLIEDMETVMGEAWGDLPFTDALAYLAQDEAADLEFLAVALQTESDEDMALVMQILSAAKARDIRVVVIAEQISPAALHRLLRSGADDFVPYPLPEGALAEMMIDANRPNGGKLLRSRSIVSRS